MRRILKAAFLSAAAVAVAIAFTESAPSAQGGSLRFSVTLPPGPAAIDGRLLVMIARDPKAGEPRFQINDGPTGQLIFGIDLQRARPGSVVTLDGSATGDASSAHSRSSAPGPRAA